MCGIWALIGKTAPPGTCVACVRALLARGPDGGRFARPVVDVTFGFTRLSINGLSNAGMQPFFRDGVHVICNGEIYNYKQLAAEHGIELTTGSDCEVLAPLIKKYGTGVARLLDGVFACIAYDTTTQTIYVMRDPYGVRPLYIGHFNNSKAIALASEIKGITPLDPTRVSHFVPGTIATFNTKGIQLESVTYHTIPWLKNPSLVGAGARTALRTALMAAVNKRMMSDRPIGCLLSGGLDSSLIAALVARLSSTPIHTFSIGMPGSTDLHYARIVAEHIGSHHHEIIVSENDFFGAIRATIAAIESYDITSVRASVGNYLVADYIRRNTDIKVVFNGDGSDEASGSYLYFYNAPGDYEFECEVERLLTEIHAFDVLRSDRSVSAHGLEARTPFLDRQFVATYLSIGTALRRPVRGQRVEKQILREAFDVGIEGGWPEERPLLPHEVLWRTKEAFSDGVSSTERSWYTVIGEKMSTTDAPATAYDYNAPYTPESQFYRDEFNKLYGAAAEKCIPHFWLAKWCGEAKDPSARTLAIYSDVK